MNKKIPEFKDEDEERSFWAKNDVLEYFDWSKAKNTVFPDLKSEFRTKEREVQSSFECEIL